MRENRYFSPSEYHVNLMRGTERRFAWQGGDFHEWQQALRERLTELLGGWPEEWDSFDVEEIEKEETNDCVRIKIVFTAEQCADVPAHLLVPKGADAPLPAMICLQGHTPGMHISLGRARDAHERASVEEDRDFAVQAVRHGFVALAMEQRCFGERAERKLESTWDHTCLDAVFHSLALGKTVLGERVWDVMRAVDLLQEQPEVDSERIACMGNSGGGTVTFYAACLERRIRLAVPSCSFCTYADSLMRIQHCGDNYIPGILKVAEMGDLAGLIAPRKLIVVAGQEDELFPIGGVRRAFETAQGIFAAAGCADNIRLLVGRGGHRFYADLAWPVIKEMI
ncbi:MAG: acetylxylan esterase [Planctomycetes bacterium]|nr:acetylxylan esterase [Planctomycetota bacterium]